LNEMYVVESVLRVNFNVLMSEVVIIMFILYHDLKPSNVE